MTNATCWINGALVPAHEARVSVFDLGLLYGDGVFEGIRFYRGKAFRLDAHLARLERSAAAIRLALAGDRDVLVKAVTATIAAYALPNGYLRLIITRGEGRLGLDPASCTRPNIIVIADELAVVPQAVRDHGARVVIAATRRLAPDGLDPRIKSLNYLNHILARSEATNAGADEAILLNQRGHVAEGSAENVFIVRDEELLTPPATDGALEGITRAAVLEIAAAAGLRWREATLSPYDLYTAGECFCFRTGHGASARTFRISRSRKSARRTLSGDMLHILLKSFLVCCALASSLAQALQLNATRLWPSPDYTRMTLEASQPVGHKYFVLSNPDRLVVDLEGVESGPALEALSTQLTPDDPYISAIRVGLNRPGVMRLVLDLKMPVKPSMFQLQPAGQYGHRLVLDLYPVSAPKAANTPVAPAPPTVAEQTKPAKPGTPQYARLITVAIDAGHGGEDPGALGANGSREKDITLALAKKLKQKIDAQENMRAVLVRDGGSLYESSGLAWIRQVARR